jgi:hypothetical protein
VSNTRRTSDRTYNPLGEYVVHLGAGFVARERPHVLHVLTSLRHHLSRWDPHQVSIEVSLQDRGRREQRVTLRTTMPGLTPVIAVAHHAYVTCALENAKHELIRQLEHLSPTRAPMHNRRAGPDATRQPGQRTN